MFKRVVAVVVLALLALPALANPPTPLLWRADGAQGSVYFLGSFHLLRDSDHPLHPALDELYARADRVVFEVSPEAMQSPELVQKFTAAGMLPPGQRLSELVAPETREKLVRHLGSEAALPAIDPLKPWFFGLGIAIANMTAAGFNPEKGIDQVFMNRVRADGKPSGGLETIDDQLAALDGAPWEEQELSLRDSLKPAAELQADINRLHMAWRTGDAEALERIAIDEMMKKTPVTARLTNRDRNERWVPQILDMLEDGGTTLVIVGALHLVGEDGVPALLQAEGVEVRRVEH